MLIHWYRIANFLYRHHVPVLPKLIYYIQYMLFNCSVPASCTIGGVRSSDMAALAWLYMPVRQSEPTV